MNDIVKTKRLALKPYGDGDQEAMVELLTNEKIKETFMVPDLPTEEEAVCMFKKLQGYSYAEDHYERGIYCEHRLIGFLNDVEISGRKIELGYVIHPLYQNQGYASEALRAAIEELFQKGFDEVVACAFAENAASFRVMEKCGMVRTEREEDMRYHGEMRRCLYYVIRKP